MEEIQKYKALYVSNLKPTTTVGDLEDFLKQNFADVKCEPLKSRYPDSYASFKVFMITEKSIKLTKQV